MSGLCCASTIYLCAKHTSPWSVRQRYETSTHTYATPYTIHRHVRIHHKHSYDQCKAFAVVFTRNACHNHRMGKRERRESVTYLYVRMRKSEEKESRTLPKLHNHYNNYSAINASAKITIDQVADGGNGIQRTNMCIVWMCYCWREHTSLIEHRDALYDSHIQSHNR